MGRSTWSAWILLSLLGATLSTALSSASTARADEPVEYRSVVVVDGAVHRGVVTASDDTHLTLKTLKGDIKIPILDILSVDPLDREAYLTQEGRRLLFLGIEAGSADQARASQISDVVMQTLLRDSLLVIPVQGLNLRLRQELASCPDITCRIESLRDEQSQVVYGVLQGKDKQERLILRRLDRNLQQVYELAIQVGDPRMERARLARSTALLLGEVPPQEPVAAVRPTPAPADASPKTGGKKPPASPATAQTPPPAQPSPAPAVAAASKPATAPAPEKKTAAEPVASAERVSSPEPEAPTPAARPIPSTAPSSDGTHNSGAEWQQAPVAELSSKDAGAGSDLAYARKLDLLPIPGASSLFYFKDQGGTIVAASTVALLTTATVYVVGDMRLLGMPQGLPVGWTYPDRASRDALLLTGTGVASYLVTTWIVNQAVRAVQVMRHRD